jgi:hypothetical protein
MTMEIKLSSQTIEKLNRLALRRYSNDPNANAKVFIDAVNWSLNKIEDGDCGLFLQFCLLLPLRKIQLWSWSKLITLYFDGVF